MPNDQRPAALTILSGNHQRLARVPVGSSRIAEFEPLRMRVTDAAGRPVPGVELRVEKTDAPRGMMVLIGGPDPYAPTFITTGEDGVASVDRYGKSVRCYIDDGPVRILVTVGRLSAVFDLTVVPPGNLPDGCTLSIVSGNHQRVPRKPSGVNGGTAVFEPLQVQLTAPQGQPLPDVEIGFTQGTESPTLAVQFEPYCHSRVNILTDTSGMATLQQMHGKGLYAYYDDGPFAVVAVAGGLKAVFELEVAPSGVRTPAQFTIVSGNHQKLPRSTVVKYPDGSTAQVPGGAVAFAPLQVRVTDAQGEPVSSLKVRFSRGEVSGGMMFIMGQHQYEPTEVMTDADGLATLQTEGKSVACYYDDGPLTVVASYRDLEAVFELLVETPSGVPEGAMLTILSGNQQHVPRSNLADVPGGTARFEPLTVRLTDAAARPIAGVEVAFAPGQHSPQMAVQIDPSARQRVRVVTDAEGLATLSAYPGKSAFCYYGEGPFTIVAAAGKAQAVFDLTVAPALPLPSLRDTLLTLVSGDDQVEYRHPGDQHIPDGVASFKPMVVKLTHRDGRPFVGGMVQFAAHSDNRAMAVQIHPCGSSVMLVPTGTDGLARLAAMGEDKVSLLGYYGAGKFTVKASVQDGPSVMFHGEVLAR